jgi:hypothetical protein
VDRLERTIACQDEKGGDYTVHVLRKQGGWTGTGSSPQMPDGLRTFVLAENPRRAISPVQGVDAFEILDAGTIIRSIGQPQRQ